MEEFHDFVNGGGVVGAKIFPAVNEHVRFALFGLRGQRRTGTAFTATLLNWTVDRPALPDPQVFDPGTLTVLNARTRTLSSFPKPEELAIGLELRRRRLILDFERAG